MISWAQMPCYYLVPNVSRQDLIEPSSVIVSRKTKLCLTSLFFHFLPLAFLCTLSFTINYKRVTGYRRAERGEQCAVTLGTALQLGAGLQLPLPAGRGGATSLSQPPLPPPESIAPRHHTNDPLKPMHHSAVHHQQWSAMWFSTEREAARTRWRVITGKYQIKLDESGENRATGTNKTENKNGNRNIACMFRLSNLRTIFFIFFKFNSGPVSVGCVI